MKKEVQNSLIVLFALILVSILLLYTQTSITGKVIYEYEENSYTWNFSNLDDYFYDDSKVSLTQNQANLIQIIEDNSWTEEFTNFSLVTLALKNGNDRTNRIISIENRYIEVNEDDILDVTFDHELGNGDIINLYLKGNQESNISLCDESTQCNISNYGFLEYHGDEGFYQIIIEALQESRNIFGFDVDDRQVRFDYINASYTTTILHNITNYTYYNSTIETNDLEIENFNQFGVFTVDNDANNQIINYQYSTDSGDNWEEIENNYNLSDINSNNIRFKINLESDNTGTPYVYSLSLGYTTAYCTENWNCTSWNECSENNLQTRNCIDLNECGTINNKPNENQTCVYYADYYEINNNGIISIRKDTLTTINSSNIILDVLVNQDANFTNFTLRNYNNHSSLLFNKISLNKYIDIESDTDLNNAILKIYYIDEGISSLNEDSLKIYSYNETMEAWQELESFVNKQENYVWANLTHFSTYGVFGNGISASSPSSNSGSSSGGGGSSRGGSSSSKKTEKIIIKEEPKETKEELKEIQEKPKEIVPEIKEEKNIFKILTGQVIDKFRNLEDYILDLIILLLIIFGVLVYKSVLFFKKK